MAAPDRMECVPMSPGSMFNFYHPNDSHAASSALTINSDVMCSDLPSLQTVETFVSHVVPG
jgi:hypothetical protein